MLEFGICALSYYNAYGFILLSVMLFIVSNILNKVSFKEIIKKGLIISAIAFVIAGWWFIRNAVIYNGDFLGLSTEKEYAETYAMPEYKPSLIETPQRKGVSLWYMLQVMDWGINTYLSFIAVFGYMNILCNYKIYVFFSLIFIAGGIGALFAFKKLFIYNKEKNKDKQKILLNFTFVFAIIIPIILSLYYSYFSDFEPQGRYIMPMLIPFIYFVVYGINNIVEKFTSIKVIKEKKYTNVIKNILIAVLCALIIIACLYCLFKVIIPYYKILLF